jgi:hypothetical protein
MPVDGRAREVLALHIPKWSSSGWRSVRFAAPGGSVPSRLLVALSRPGDGIQGFEPPPTTDYHLNHPTQAAGSVFNETDRGRKIRAACNKISTNAVEVEAKQSERGTKRSIR